MKCRICKGYWPQSKKGAAQNKSTQVAAGGSQPCHNLILALAFPLIREGFCRVQPDASTQVLSAQGTAGSLPATRRVGVNKTRVFCEWTSSPSSFVSLTSFSISAFSGSEPA
jgi:hypothetical protein